MKIISLLLASMLLAPTGAAQLISDTLVADINGGPFAVGSYSGAFASDGNLVYFNGVDLASGESYRVWRSDGTAAGTLQLTTLAVNEHESVFADDGELYMIVDELGIGVTLWKSDGTPAGTVELLPPPEWSVEPYDLTSFDGAVWFLAGTETTGVEVWKSDPVTGTTAMAFELAAGPSSGAGNLFASATHLFVSPPGATTLLAGDGTLASFSTVATFSFPGSGSFDHVARVGDLVMFNVGGFASSAGWWSSDGTAAGTQRIHESFNDFWAVAAATRIYFTAGGPSEPRLWETDGTLAGTLPVDDATSIGGQRVSFLYPGLAVGDEFFFGGFVAGAGFEPSRAGGGAPGSTIIFDVNAGSADSDAGDFVLFDGKVYFRADDGVHGREIWALDLALGITRLVSDITPGPGAGIVGTTDTIVSAQHGVVFGQNFEGFGLEPGVTDGVQTGLLLNIADDGSSAGSGPNNFVRLGDRVLFQAAAESTGIELWASDGTTAGTSLVADIDPTPPGTPGSLGSIPHHLTRFGDRVVFFAAAPATGSELWITDGTDAGTALIADVVPGPASSEPLFSAPPVVLNGTLYAILREPSGAFALYASDGTAAGTSKVLTTDPTGAIAEFVTLVTINDRLIFNANLGGDLELWSSDGTAAGSALLVDATPSGGTVFPTVVVGDTVVYFSSVDGSDHTIWRTDGTSAGTEAIFSQVGVPFLGAPVIQATFGDQVVFTTSEPGFGIEPWISDGTPEGTLMLADIAPGDASSRSTSYVSSGDRVYFTVESPPGSSHFQQVWATDGTAAGTGLVIELPSPVAGAGVGDFWAPGDNGELVFSNVDANGEEWWVTDGTAGGTRALTDIAPGAAFAKPQAGILLGSTLMFAANDGDSGFELHALPYEATDSYAVTSIGEGCAGANGTPSLSLGSGSPSVGEAFVLSVASANPSQPVYWAFDFGFGSHAPAGTCALQIALPTLLTVTPADELGNATLPLAVPGVAMLTGIVVDFQAFSSEPGGPFLGLGTLTNVLEVVVGP